MSTAKISFAQLPEAGEVKSGDYFVIEDVLQAKKLKYENLIFGLENVTFASTISSQSTDIVALSAEVDSLSATLDNDVINLNALISTTISTTTAAFINVIYPINTVLYTTTNLNPGTYLTGTTWDQVAQGLFIAGVGSGVDKNGIGFTVGEGTAASNANAGEYTHALTVAEMAAHTHTFTPISETNSSTYGPYNESAPGPGAPLAPITSSSTGGNTAHNNIPPLYGLYVWKRTS